MNIILRIVSGIGGLTMLSYGVYGLALALTNPSLRMYLRQGGSDTVRIFNQELQMSARLFVLFIYLFVLMQMAGGAWLCSTALRGRGDHAS